MRRRGRTVQKQVTLLDDLLVRCRLVLRRKLVGGDDPIDLVDSALQPTGRNEAREISAMHQQSLLGSCRTLTYP
jgi:hypothetical protein